MRLYIFVLYMHLYVLVCTVQEDGLNCLLDLLASMDWDTAQSNIHTAALGCVKALMNNSVSRQQFIHRQFVV